MLAHFGCYDHAVSPQLWLGSLPLNTRQAKLIRVSKRYLDVAFQSEAALFDVHCPGARSTPRGPFLGAVAARGCPTSWQRSGSPQSSHKPLLSRTRLL